MPPIAATSGHFQLAQGITITPCYAFVSGGIGIAFGFAFRSLDEASRANKSTQNAIPRKRMTSRHAVVVPLNVRVVENRRAGQNWWLLARAKKPLTLRGNWLAGRSYTAKNRGARFSLSRLSASVPRGVSSWILTWPASRKCLLRRPCSNL